MQLSRFDIPRFSGCVTFHDDGRFQQGELVGDVTIPLGRDRRSEVSMIRLNKSNLAIPATVLILIAVVVGFLILEGDALGMDADDTNTIVALIPAILVLFVSFGVVAISSGLLMSGAVTGVGLAFAFLIHQMNDVGLLIPDLEISATDLQLVIIIIFLILGVGLAIRER